MAWNPNKPQLTDVIADSITDIRENFQHLDPLAQAVGELQAVSELAPYVQALFDSRVVEMGSNANGEYVRWENGLQVCWHKVSLVYFTRYVLEGIWTYPAAFTAEPRVFHVPIHGQRTGASGAEQYANGVVQSLSNTWAQLRQHAINATDRFIDGDILPVSAFAIGRWK